jgi:outer membrane receptor protein involved in Fe transport
MRRMSRGLLRIAALSAAFAAFSWASVATVWADVFGHLRLVVKSAGTDKPISGAKVVLKDSAGVKPDIELITDLEGVVVSPPLENRDWEVRVESGGTLLLQQSVTVVADTITDVEVVDQGAPPTPGQKGQATLNLIRKAQSVLTAIRSKRFADLFPIAAGDNFNLEAILRTIPGFTSGAVGQVFSRGDQRFGAIYVNGMKLPEILTGQRGENLAGELIANVEAMTGGLPAEYAGLASSVINVNLRGGTLEPDNAINLFGGTFATFDGTVVLSGQVGRSVGDPGPDGRAPKNLGYFVTLGGRQTDNGIQSPQPNQQEENNTSRYGSFFGNFDYRPNRRDQINVLLNRSPSKTDVANRAGLGSGWPTEGYGFGGLFPGGGQGRGLGGMMSQAEMGLDVHREGENNFGLLQWRRQQDENTDWSFSFGASHMGNDMGHNNPSVDIMNMPFNSSHEFNPNIARNNRSWQAQGTFHRKSGDHDFKIGFFVDENNGRESYQMIPASNMALNALYAVDPRLAPPTRPFNPEEPEFDPLGNEIRVPTGSTVPTLRTEIKRQNRSFFAQDDWRPSDRFSVNYGARFDSFVGKQNLGMADSRKNMVSPRVNMAYQYDHRTVIRGSYNRLFLAPPNVQGEMIGATPKVGTADQFDFSFERSIGPTASMKISAFHKEMRDQLYVRQMIRFLQDGPLVGVNLDESQSKGIEVSAQMTPIEGKGFSGFLTWTNSVANGNGMTSDGAAVPETLPADQRNTITAGFNYMWANGANWALSWEYGSGLPTADMFGLSDRRQQGRANFRFQSGQTTFGPFGGFTVDIENLFDSKTVIGFNSPVNGTRFQQGRRIVISAFSEFLSR